MQNLFKAQTNLGSQDRVIRGVLGSCLLLYTGRSLSDSPWIQGGKLIGSLLLGSSLLGFDPFLSFWGTTTTPGRPNNIFHLLAQMLPGQKTPPSLAEQPFPGRKLRKKPSQVGTIAHSLSVQ